MRECVRALCILSIVCGAVLSLCPEGVAKKILRVLPTVVLLAVIFDCMGKLDLAPYSLELARSREWENTLLRDSGEMSDRLNRLVIEQEYASYVERRAEAAGVTVSEIRIRARWSKEGLWLPDSSRIHLIRESEKEVLAQILLAELGIPREHQEWTVDG